MPLNTVKTEKPPSKKLPQAAVAFAKKMGVDMTGLEAEAQDMWKMLEEMSVNDPIGYAKFVHDQLAEGNMEQMMGGKGGDDKAAAGPGAAVAGGGKNKQGGKSSTDANSSSSSSSESEERFLRPKAGFCVELRTCGGEDGVKVREMDAKKKKASGKPLYINMCWHDALQPPTDQNTGRIVSMESNRPSADGMELPLAIGPLRNHTLELEVGSKSAKSESVGDAIVAGTVQCLVVDVVVHPYVVGMCLQRAAFMSQVMDLVVEWVQQERRIEIDKSVPWEFVAASPEGVKGSSSSSSSSSSGNSRKSSGRALGNAATRNCGYMAGRGDDQNVPAMFPINSGTCSGSNVPEGKSGAGKSGGGDLLADPATMLQQMQRDKEREASVGGDVTTLNAPSSGGAAADMGVGAGSDIMLPFQMARGGKGAKGGEAENRVPFQQQQSQSKGPLVTEVGVESAKKTSALRAASNNEKSDSASCATASPAAGASVSAAAKKSTPGISAKPAGGPSVKKGFLNKPTAAGKLYPEGSNEGSGGAKGGSYASFMSRCQVVDTATGKTTMPSAPPAKAKPAAATAPAASSSGGAAPKAAPKMTQSELSDLENLIGAADDEFRSLTAHETEAASAQHAAFDEGNILKQLATFGLGRETWDTTRPQNIVQPPAPPAAESSAAPSSSSGSCCSSVSNSSSLTVSCSDPSLTISSKWVDNRLVTEIGNVQPAMAAAMDLQVATDQIRVMLQPTAGAGAGASSSPLAGVVVPPAAQRRLDGTAAGAKYSKKHARMTITVAAR